MTTCLNSWAWFQPENLLLLTFTLYSSVILLFLCVRKYFYKMDDWYMTVAASKLNKCSAAFLYAMSARMVQCLSSIYMNMLQNSKSGRHAENITSDYVFQKHSPERCFRPINISSVWQPKGFLSSQPVKPAPEIRVNPSYTQKIICFTKSQHIDIKIRSVQSSDILDCVYSLLWH